jgi:hypothetical protein
MICIVNKAFLCNNSTVNNRNTEADVGSRSEAATLTEEYSAI